MSQAAHPNPLKVIQTRNSTAKAGWLIYENQYYFNKADGYAVVEFPFAAGLHKSKGCTRTDLRQSRLNAKGGLRVKLKLSQSSFCFWPRYAATLSFKYPSNPTTQIVIDSKGQIAYYPALKNVVEISQIDDNFTLPPLNLGINSVDNVTYFSVKTGAIEAESSNGQRAIVNSGQTGVVSPEGVKVIQTPEAEYLYGPFMGRSPLNPYTHGKIYFEEPNSVYVDGKPVKAGQTVWPVGGIQVKTPFE